MMAAGHKTHRKYGQPRKCQTTSIHCGLPSHFGKAQALTTIKRISVGNNGIKKRWINHTKRSATMVLNRFITFRCVHWHIKLNIAAAWNVTLSKSMFHTLITMLNHFFGTSAITNAQTTFS